MDKTIYCQACEEAIDENETSVEIRRCAQVNGDLCPAVEYGFFHAACVPPDHQEKSEK